MDYNVEFIGVDKLVPYEKNAKKHPQEQVDMIAKSIKRFGFRQNLVIDKDNVVVIGHGRLLAARQLGLAAVPCVRVENLSEDEIKALRLADNRVAESEWDIDLMMDELDELAQTDLDMSDFGFSVQDMEFMDFEEAEAVEHSKRMNSTIVSVILGFCKFEMDDKTHAIYEATKRINVEKATEILTRMLLNGDFE